VIFGRLQAPPAQRRLHSETCAPSRATTRRFRKRLLQRGGGFPTVDFGNAILRLTPWEERKRKQQDITRELNQRLSQLRGDRLCVIRRRWPVAALVADRVRDHGADPICRSGPHGRQLHCGAEQVPGVQALQTDLRLNTPELRVDVNRDKLGDVVSRWPPSA